MSELPTTDIQQQRVARRRAVRFAMLTWLLLLVFTQYDARNQQNPLSRFVAVESLVERGEFHIDGSPYARKTVRSGDVEVHWLNDMVYNKRDGHFYSSKPPVYTILLAAVLWPLKKAGAQFSSPDPDLNVPVFMLTWLVVGAMTAVGFYAFRRKVGENSRPLEADLVTVLTLGGTLFLSYSVTMNHHTFTAALVLLSFFLFGMDRAAPSVSDGRAAAAGFMMGLATVVDCGHGFAFSIAFGVYALLYLRSPRALVFYALGSVPPLAAHCIVQYSIWGSVLPVQMIEGTKDYQGSYWRYAGPPDSWRIRRSYYWLLTLFSARGLFILSPVLLIGAAALARDVQKFFKPSVEPAEAGGTSAAQRSGQLGRGWAAICLLGGIAFLFVYHWFMAPTNFCGSCFGFRWFIGFTPLLAFYAARGYMQWKDNPRFRRFFYALGLISVTYALIGMRGPWMLMEGNPHPAVRFLVLLLRGFHT